MAQHTFTTLSNAETSAFCSQLAMILQAGISSIEGITLMLEESKKPEEQQLLSAIQKALYETGSLHQALAAAGAFPDYLLQMVHIGEQAGRLDEVMGALAVHYERETSISQSIRNAVTYPLIMIGMMLLVIVILVTKVMPVFNQVFRQLGSEMTGFSRGVLQIGNALNRYSVIFVIILAVLIISVLFLTHAEKGRSLLRRFAAAFPWTRSISGKMAACRFASGMALTLKSGITQSQCLKLASGLTDNEAFLSKLTACSSQIEQGVDLSKALLDNGIFTGIYARMTAIGTKTGTLDEVMGEIADKYQEEVDRKFTGIIATLEPTLVIILSLIVGVILLSVMLPLMGIMSGL